MIPESMWHSLVTLFVVSIACSSASSDSVLLSDIKVLTLYTGRMTTSRRSHPVPQLKCVGGSANCHSVPDVVQCYNRGSDGYDVQWECKADMDNAYRFGQVEVSCEGYAFPEDPYVLKGSCGLEYQLELTKEGQQQKYRHGHQHHSYDDSYGYSGGYKQSYSSKKSTGFGDLVTLVVVGVIIYAVYQTCINNQRVPGQDGYDGGHTFRQGGGQQPPPPGFRSDYMPGDGCSSSYGSSYGGHNTGFNSFGTRQRGGFPGGGFWTGAATGGLLGYMFGNRGNTGYHHRQPYTRSPFSSGFGSSGSSGFSVGGGSSGTRTASGFGGTKRR